METNELASVLLKSVASEINLWAEECGTITNGYDYESRFTERVRTINRILLEKSVELKGKARDKKKSTPVLVQ